MATGTTGTASQAASLQSSSTVTSFTVTDTAANIEANFAALNGDTKLTSITVSPSAALVLTYAQFTTDTTALGLLASGTTVSVSGVTVANAAAIQASTAATSFVVSDTAANVVAALATLSTQTKLIGITLTGGSTLPVTYTQYSTYSKLLALLDSPDTLVVSASTVANAAALQTASLVSGFTVSDTAANILASLAVLAADTKLTAVAVSSGTLAITYTQYTTYARLTGLISTAGALTVSAATAANAGALQSAAAVGSFTISDTGANIANALSTLAADTKLSAIAVTPGTTVSVTFAQYTTYTKTLALLSSTDTLIVSGAAIANAATLQSAGKVSSFAVTDTAANVLAGLTALAADAKLSSITLTGTTALALTDSQYTSYTSTADKLASGDTLTVSAAPVSGATAVQADSHVGSFTITDTGTNVAAGLAALATDNKLTSIILSGTTAVSVTGAVYTADASTLDKLASGDLVTVTAALATGAAALQADSHVGSFAITDTTADVTSGITTLAADTKLSAITLSGATALAVTGSQYTAYTSTLDKLTSGDTLTVSAALAAGSAALQADTHVGSFALTDTAANIVSGISALAADSKLSSITLSGTTALAVTDAQYASYTSTLDKLAVGDTLTVSAAPGSGAAALQADTHVGSFAVTDTTANIISGISVLAVDTKLSSITLSGATALAVTDTQYTTYTSTLDKLASGDTLTVSAAPVAGAPGLQADTHVGSFSITDTGPDVLAGASALAADTKLSSITLSGTTSITVTYAQYAAGKTALDNLTSGDTMIVTGVSAANAATVAADTHVKTLTVSDSLANIGTSLSALQTLAASGQLTGIAVTDSGQNLAITAAQSSADATALGLMTGTFTVTRPVINLIWDSSVASAPAGFVSAVEDAANYFDALITSPITINIDVGYGEVNGTALPASYLGETVILNSASATTAQITTDLSSVTPSAAITSAIASLSTAGEPTSVTVEGGEAKALGITAGYATGADAAIGFELDPTGRLFTYDPNNRAVLGEVDFVSVAEAEIGHALGRDAFAGVSTALDLYRFAAPGTIGVPGSTATYFSVNGGTTNLDNFATSFDLGDWAPSAGNDALDATIPTGVENLFSSADVTETNVLGYSIASNAPSSAATIPASAAGGLSAATLTFIGTPIVLTMGTTTTAATVSIPPAGGIEEINSFTYGTDVLTVNLSDLSGTLVAFDTTIGSVHAVAITGSNDPTHGLVLTGMPAADTAANLLSSHVTIAGSTATIT